MLTADSDQKSRGGLASLFYSPFHQFTHALAVQNHKGVVRQNLLILVGLNEFALGIIPGKTQGSLGKIIGAKGKEISQLGKFVCQQGSPGDFDHGTHGVLK
ncbi:MAG: hypothetical protein BWY80_00829 [Firmicutes bacterium ADurb.Bin456]|nr:MAG: hypothetical protein BWY80_00829 [Firmicutes bacterium ADurb.Bin456]